MDNQPQVTRRGYNRRGYPAYAARRIDGSTHYAQPQNNVGADPASDQIKASWGWQQQQQGKGANPTPGGLSGDASDQIKAGWGWGQQQQGTGANPTPFNSRALSPDNGGTGDTTIPGGTGVIPSGKPPGAPGAQPKPAPPDFTKPSSPSSPALAGEPGGPPDFTV